MQRLGDNWYLKAQDIISKRIGYKGVRGFIQRGIGNDPRKDKRWVWPLLKSSTRGRQTTRACHVILCTGIHESMIIWYYVFSAILYRSYPKSTIGQSPS